MNNNIHQDKGNDSFFYCPAQFLIIDLLETLFRNLPIGILTLDHQAFLRRLVSKLPIQFSSFTLIENHLTKESTLPDFSINIDPCNYSDERGLLRSTSIEPVLRDAPEWLRIAEFAKKWEEPDSNYSEHIKDLWLEFDMPHSISNNIPIPSVFLGLNNETSSNSLNAELVKNTVIEGITQITGKKHSSATLIILRRCFEELPPDGELSYIGTMLPRDPSNLRVCVKMPLHEVPRYLSRLSKDTNKNILMIVDDLKNVWNMVTLDLDINRILGDRIGFEFNYDAPAGNDKDSPWEILIGYLVNKGWCTIEKAELLCQVQTMTEMQKHSALLHSVNENAISSEKNNCTGIVSMGNNHLKLSVQPDRSIEAKNYIFVNHTIAQQLPPAENQELLSHNHEKQPEKKMFAKKVNNLYRGGSAFDPD